MLTRKGCEARRARLWQAVPDDVEWLLIADPRHVHYFSNFWVQPLSFSGGERGLLLLEREEGATLFGDNFTLRSAAGEPYVDREVIEDWYDHEHSVINRDHALQMAIKTVDNRLFARKGILEAEALPLAVWDLLGLDRERHRADMEAGQPSSNGDTIDLGTLIRQLRRQKEPDELDLLRQCMKAGEAGHTRAREVIRPGVTELDVYREVQSAAIAAAGRPAIVYGDFRAVNAKSPKAGGLPTSYELQDDDLFILDYSVVLDGYRSDFTNTYAVGSVSDEQEMLFRLCEAGMRAGEEVLKAGARAADVYAAVSQPMTDAGYPRLGHHAGHGIGLAHPEPPILVPESDDILMAGDVVTLEPGMYVEGIGGMRIEHNYLITEHGYEQLSQHVISLT
ncbi:MAG: Xaa-Pro peptidase family protein [Planctomycetaceae bacterium]